jgi:P-47 protein
MTEPTPQNMCKDVVVPPTTGKADTYNWDTAYGITFEKVNASIIRANSSPPNFKGIYVDGFSGDKYEIAGDFGPWQLSGGAGDLLHMTLPLTDGTVTPQNGGNPTAYSGSAAIEVKLEWIPQPNATSSSGTNHLKIKLTANPDDSPIVSVESVDVTPKGVSEGVQSVLEDWLLANLQQFNHVFSVVDLGAVADKGGFQWLKPTRIGYAVNTEGASDPKNYVFGVLAMTEGRTVDNLSSQISPNIIPTGADAGFLISQERFLKKLLLPGMAALFKNAIADDFEVDSDGTMVRNKFGLFFRGFQLEDGSVIDQVGIDAQKFSVEARATSLFMMFDDLSFPWNPEGSVVKDGFVVHLTYTAESVLFLDQNHHLQMCTVGKRDKDPKKSTGPTLNTIVTKTDNEKAWEIVLGLVEGITLAIIGAVIGGALGPEVDEAGAAGEQAAVEAAENAGEGAVDFNVESVGDGEVENLPKENADADGEAAAESEQPSRLAKFKGFFRRNWRKMLGATIGSIAGVGLANLPQILEAYAENDLKNMPTLDEFADESINSTSWPGATDTELVTAALNGSLQLGIQITFDE